MSDQDSEAQALKNLAGRKPTAERLAVVEAALASKWEGTQSLALQILQEWGGRRSVELIRLFLEETWERKCGWAVRRVAINALAKIVGPEDAEWIKAVSRARTGTVEQHELRPLTVRLAKLSR